jgi:DNA-binding CsgD family transcriptional regulator
LLIVGVDRKEIAMNMKIKQATLIGYIKDIKQKNKLGLAELIRSYVYWHKQ